MCTMQSYAILAYPTALMHSNAYLPRSWQVDESGTIRPCQCGWGESFLKLYVFFNMLELFERWLRSVGVDLFDLLAASCRQSLLELLPKYLLASWHWYWDHEELFPVASIRLVYIWGVGILFCALFHAYAAGTTVDSGHQHIFDALQQSQTPSAGHSHSHRMS